MLPISKKIVEYRKYLRKGGKYFCVIAVCFNFQVQSNHFEEFFAPELDKHGYQALFKRKTAEVRSA